MVVRKIYDKLLEEYGHQGWWPLLSHNGINPTKTGSVNGYHPGEYDFPKNDDEKFEIICGALLTQNTSWPNVEKALINLKDAELLSAQNILETNVEEIKKAIKPAGYFNQKGERLKVLADFFIKLEGKTPGRDELLLIKGVGPETADSILLYAYGIPSFVVDSYTRRIVIGLGLLNEGVSYDEIKSFFEDGLGEGVGEEVESSGMVDGDLGKVGDYKVFQEYHALLVEHAKRFYVVKNIEEDFLKKLITG